MDRIDAIIMAEEIARAEMLKAQDRCRELEAINAHLTDQIERRVTERDQAISSYMRQRVLLNEIQSGIKRTFQERERNPFAAWMALEQILGAVSKIDQAGVAD